ncbi:MAG: PAS domain S-box protein [Woeseiaceae bacterium]|nr:PAS domain S-box protein [Woeseiaceae bacterium]
MNTLPLPAEAALTLLEASAEGMIITDADGRIVFVNREAELLFGYAAEEMLGKEIEMLVPEEHREQHAGHRERYRKAPHSRPMVAGLDLRGRRKDGTEFHAEISLLPIETDAGLIVASAIRELQPRDESEAYFRTMLESAPDAMIIVDEDGRIAIVNGQAEQMFGYARDELLGRHIETLLPERIRQRHREHRAGFAARPSLRPMGAGMDLIALRSNGSEFPVEISLSPVATAQGAFVSTVIRDVTERKQMEAEIIAARQQAERANKANSAFLAAASHDLRQPVQALSLINGALRRTVKDNRALEMIEIQENSLTAMTNLLNSLLDISRLDAGAVTPDFEEFTIQRVIDRLSGDFGRQARHKGLEFSATGCGAVVRSDPNLLAEILQNFVSNAIRYTEKGRVRLVCATDEGHCRLSVEDTGIGIEEDQLEAIFQEFNQGSSTVASKEGFGLGLAIVRRLADLLGHEIRVSSVPGKGSTFSVLVPLVAGAVATTETAESTPAAAAAASGTVVLIEDDVNVANAWSLLLEAEGYRVASVKSAPEARAAIRHLDEIPVLLISDFHLLDGSTGVEAVGEIREYYGRDIPAFIVSGDTSKVVKEARPVENCTLMSKPVDTERLLRAARAATASGTVPAD